MRNVTVLLWLDRLREHGVALLAAAGIFAGLGAVFILDQHVIDRAVVHGKVDGWSMTQHEYGLGSYVIGVRLDDGTWISAGARPEGRAPQIGERIEVTRTRTGLGRRRYLWAN